MHNGTPKCILSDFNVFTVNEYLALNKVACIVRDGCIYSERTKSSRSCGTRNPHPLTSSIHPWPRCVRRLESSERAVLKPYIGTLHQKGILIPQCLDLTYVIDILRVYRIPVLLRLHSGSGANVVPSGASLECSRGGPG